MKSVIIYATNEESIRPLCEIYANHYMEFWNALHLKSDGKTEYSKDTFTLVTDFNSGSRLIVGPKKINTSSGAVMGIVFDFSKLSNELDDEISVASRIRSVVQRCLLNYSPNIQITTGLLE